MHSQSLPKVTVVDALMGSGKTTLVIRKMGCPHLSGHSG